jgi:signal transduction histidine kinase
MASLLLLGRNLWPAVFIGAFLVNLTTSGSVGISLGIGVGNTLEAVAGAWLVARFARGTQAFEEPRDVLRFVVLGGLLATTLSATIGVTTLVLGGSASASDFGQIWLTWWLGDAAGVLVVAPAVICWLVGEPFECGRAQLIEAIGFLVVLTLLGSLTLGSGMPLRFLCIPLVIWTAFRFGNRGTTTTVLLLSGFAVWGTLRSLPILASQEENQALLVLQLFMAVMSVTGLALTAAVAERRRALDAVEWQARELARSNAELDDFAHVVSHDLKAPLRGIASLARWVIDDCKDALPEESTEHLHLLEARAKRMSRLIDGILAHSRIARTRGTPRRIDSGAILAEVLDSLGPASASIRIEGPLPVVRYDRTQLAQVFQNLIGNAVQHMGREDGSIVISCHERPEVFEFSVRDDGVGIEEQHAERIFRMFHALHPERDTTGVGLAIVKTIVETHGGAIHVQPADGGGADFRFSVRKPVRDRLGQFA